MHKAIDNSTLELIQLIENISKSKYFELDQMKGILHYIEQPDFELMVSDTVHFARYEIEKLINPQNSEEVMDLLKLLLSVSFIIKSKK